MTCRCGNPVYGYYDPTTNSLKMYMLGAEPVELAEAPRGARIVIEGVIVANNSGGAVTVRLRACRGEDCVVMAELYAPTSGTMGFGPPSIELPPGYRIEVDSTVPVTLVGRLCC